MSRVLASTTTAEYLGAEELAPNASLHKNKIKMALMPEKTNLTGLPQIFFTDLRRLIFKDNTPFDSRIETLEKN